MTARNGYSWFPDWSGCIAAIIASGPSAKKVDLSILAQKAKVRVIAIKRSHELFPGAHVIYGCDAHWWRAHNGIPQFRGIKIAYEPILSEIFPDIHLIRIDLHDDRFLLDEPGRIGCGGNSGFQAVNLALQFGARQVILVGFDMHDKSGPHWYGRNEWNGANNPGQANFHRWRHAFKIAAPAVASIGIEIVNATRYSDCKEFRFVPSIEVALNEWKV